MLIPPTEALSSQSQAFLFLSVTHFLFIGAFPAVPARTGVCSDPAETGTRACVW